MPEFVFQDFDPTLPERRYHKQDFIVAATDIDELEHVNNSVYLRYADTAAIIHSARLGMAFNKMKSLGIVPVVHGHIIKYHKSAVLGDTLEDTTWTAECAGFRAVRYHEMRRLEDNALLVQIKTNWVWIDPITSRPKRIPAVVLEAFGF